MRRILAALVAAGFLGPGPASAAEPTGRVVGTLVFRERDRTLTPADAERAVHGKRISLSLRNGWQVATARLERDGRFAVDLAPGSWRLEWIDVGDRAEILATPLAVEVPAGRTTCAGRIELAFGDVESELGASAAGTVRVAGDCDGAAVGGSTARPAEELYAPPFGFPEYADGLRVAGFFTDQEPGLGVTLAVPIRRPLAWMGGVVLIGGASRLFASDGARDAFELGGGFVPYWGAELTGGVRWESGAGGAPFAALRLGPAPYAFIARVDLRDGATWTFGLELTAFHVIGRFL